MESYELIKKIFTKATPKRVAADMNLSSSLIYKWMQEPGFGRVKDQSGTLNPIDRVLQMCEICQDKEPVRWLCQRLNGFFVSNTEISEKNLDAEYIEQTQKILSEFSSLLTTISDSYKSDSSIDQSEAEAIREKWEDLKECSETFVVACEKGCYKSELEKSS